MMDPFEMKSSWPAASAGEQNYCRWPSGAGGFPNTSYGHSCLAEAAGGNAAACAVEWVLGCYPEVDFCGPECKKPPRLGGFG